MRSDTVGLPVLPCNACEDIVPMSKLLAVSTAGALAIALVSCSEATAPTKAAPRTVSVATTAAVPAVPTVPVALTTNTTESKVTVTLPVAGLTALVQAAGGPVSITMTDLAAKDYASRLPAGTAALIDPAKTAGVFQFSTQRSGASQTALSSETVYLQGTSTILAGSVAITPFGQSCTPGTVTGFILSGGTKTSVALTSVSVVSGVVNATAPVPISFWLAGFSLLFEFTGVSGSFGA